MITFQVHVSYLHDTKNNLMWLLLKSKRSISNPFLSYVLSSLEECTKKVLQLHSKKISFLVDTRKKFALLLDTWGKPSAAKTFVEFRTAEKRFHKNLRNL